MPALNPPDRTKDIPPPQRGTHRECKCGKLMIPRVDYSAQHQGYATWHWWCGCGEVAEGGKWHPQTADESLMETWKRHNDEAAATQAKRVAQEGRVISLDCKHENKTVADGGWTCNDCGRVGGIAKLSDHMRAMPPAWRRKWCDAENCECTGCASGKGKLKFWGFTKAKWEEWLQANPTASELLADIVSAHAVDPSADAGKLTATVLSKRPTLENQRLLQIIALSHIEAHGVQQDVPTHS